MWVDSGAGALSLGSIFVHFTTFILFFVVLGLLGYQYIRKRNKKSFSKLISFFGIGLSTLILLINVLMTFAHMEFVMEQTEIINNPDYHSTNTFIRQGWVENGYDNILWSIMESLILGLLPLWIFYRQHRMQKLIY